MSTNISVLLGDIAQAKTDALLTAINSGGMWFGGIDGVIMRCAGDQFHSQAAAMLARNATTNVIVAPKQYQHDGRFENVVFTIDDVNEPLQDVVLRGLNATADAGYRTVSMPAVRLGVMKNLGGTQAEKVNAIVQAIREHERSHPNPLQEVTIVTYEDAELVYEFEEAIGKA